jgi:hypothetical protein
MAENNDTVTSVTNGCVTLVLLIVFVVCILGACLMFSAKP